MGKENLGFPVKFGFQVNEEQVLCKYVPHLSGIYLFYLLFILNSGLTRGPAFYPAILLSAKEGGVTLWLPSLLAAPCTPPLGLSPLISASVPTKMQVFPRGVKQFLRVLNLQYGGVYEPTPEKPCLEDRRGGGILRVEWEARWGGGYRNKRSDMEHSFGCQGRKKGRRSPSSFSFRQTSPASGSSTGRAGCPLGHQWGYQPPQSPGCRVLSVVSGQLRQGRVGN